MGDSSVLAHMLREEEVVLVPANQTTLVHGIELLTPLNVEDVIKKKNPIP